MSRNRELPALFGGPGWSPRSASLKEELGTHWKSCGIDSEVARLRAVLLHRPGPELEESQAAQRVHMLEPLDLATARSEHELLAQAYREAGVEVHLVEPLERPRPNLMFVADLLVLTPEGAILGRPASEVRAGEERHAAAALARLGIPILASIRGEGVFEGADLAWLGPSDVLLAEGIRTNREGADQVESILRQMGVRTHRCRLPRGAMHLMGQLRFLNRIQALIWPARIDEHAISALRSFGYDLLEAPDEDEAVRQGMNFVTLDEDKVLMPAGRERTQRFLEANGIDCITVEVSELCKAAGAIGCLTGVLERRAE